MNLEKDRPGKDKVKIEAAGRRLSFYLWLRPVGRSLILSLLILVFVVSFTLLISSDPKGGVLYLVNVFVTALVAFFAILLVIQVSRLRRESRRNEQIEQLRLKDKEFFKRLEDDVDSLLQEVRSRDG